MDAPLDTVTFVANLALGYQVPGLGFTLTTDGPIRSRRSGLRTTWYRAAAELAPQQALAATGMGELVLTDHELKSWLGYRFELFGTRLDREALPPGMRAAEGPTFPLYLQDIDATVELLIWRHWASYENSPLRAERLWIPDGRERVSIRVLEPDATYNQTATERAFRGLALLRGHSLLPAVARAVRRARSDEEALSEVLGWARDWLQRHPDGTPLDIGHQELYETSGMTPGSTENFLARHHITLPKIRQKLGLRDGI